MTKKCIILKGGNFYLLLSEINTLATCYEELTHCKIH